MSEESEANKTSQASAPASSNAARYAQVRRDNEIKAREDLDSRLPAQAFRPEISARGDFNPSTKTMIAALFFLDPSITVEDTFAVNIPRSKYDQHRRDNEITIRGRLESIIPASLFCLEGLDRVNLSYTAKVIIAAHHRVGEVLGELPRGRDDAGYSSSILSDPNNITAPPSSLLADQDESDSTHSHSKMKRFTRSSKKAKAKATSDDAGPQSSPTASTTYTTQASSQKFEGIDLLASLRADELDQEINIGQKPAQLPKKLFENQGYWQIKRREVIVPPNTDIYVQALEQAANRLVAKAKELVIAYDGDEEACSQPLAEAQEWCIDTINMISGETSVKEYKKKCAARKKVWDENEEQFHREMNT